MDLALNNQQWLICHKTKPNQSSQTGASRFNVIPRWGLPLCRGAVCIFYNPSQQSETEINSFL